MRRAMVILVGVSIAGVLAWEFCQRTVWIGGFDLMVHIQEPEGGLRSVCCKAFFQREYAEEHLAHLTSMARHSPIGDWFKGSPLHANVTVTGASSPFGRELRRHQFSSLAVMAVMSDGRLVGKIIEIPDGRVSREVFVAFP